MGTNGNNSNLINNNETIKNTNNSKANTSLEEISPWLVTDSITVKKKESKISMQPGTSEARAHAAERPGPSLRSCTARPLESDRVSMLKTSSSTPARRARSTQRHHHSSMSGRAP